MKIAICGDIHFKGKNPRKRLDDYTESLFLKLSFILYRPITHFEHLGDLISDPKQLLPDWMKNKAIRVFRDAQNRGIQLDTILGNHDFPNEDFDSIQKTSFYNIILSKAMNYRKCGEMWKIDNTMFVAIPYLFDEAVAFIADLPKMLDSKTEYVILLGHHFYEWGLDMEHSIVQATLQPLMNDFARKYLVFLGHDHQQHDPISLGNVTVYRPGSLMRAEQNEYNLTQQPCIYEYDTETHAVEKVTVPCKPAEEIFDVKHYTICKSVKRTFDEIKERLKGLKLSSNHQTYKMSDELVRIDAPTDVIDYIRSLYVINNQEF